MTTSAPGVHFDGAFTADVDSDAGSVTTTGQGVTLTVGDLTFTDIDLTLIGAHDAAGPVLWITGGSGATATFGGPGGLLIATLTGALQLVITSSGATFDAPVTLAPAAAGVVAPGGSFQLRVDSNGSARLESPAATLATAAGTISGAMTLHDATTASGERVVVADVFGGSLAPLSTLVQLFAIAAIAGSFLLSGRGVVGGASGTATFHAAGIATGSSPVRLEINGTGAAIVESVVVDGVNRSVLARGPPVGGAPIFDLRGPEAVFTAGALTLTVANPGLLGAPVGAAPWLVDLSGPAGRVVAVTADGADLVLTVDGVSARRLAAAVPSVVITGSDGNDVLRINGVPATAVTFAGGAGRDAVYGPAVDLDLDDHRRRCRHRGGPSRSAASRTSSAQPATRTSSRSPPAARSPGSSPAAMAGGTRCASTAARPAASRTCPRAPTPAACWSGPGRSTSSASSR